MECNTTFTRSRKLRGIAGATLVEFMVALAIGSVVLMALAALMSFTARGFAAVINYIDLDQKGRNALDKITAQTYLTLIQAQHRSTMQSLAWNSALIVAESGIEEAMTHLDYNGPGSIILTNGLSKLNNDGAGNLLADGWGFTNGVYWKQRTLSSDSYYVATITSNRPPVVNCVGYTQNPLNSTYLIRQVTITTTNNGMFLKGLVVKKGINSNGNSVTADAFDSINPLYSTNGQYDKTKATDGGGIATTSSLANQIALGGGKIYGPVSTGPGGSLNTSGLTIGDHVWQLTHSGVELGWVTSDMNVSFPDVSPPFTGGYSTPAGGTVNGVSYSYILTNGNYQLSGNFSGKVLVTGDAVLYLPTSASMSFSSSDSITVNTNASLQLYVACATASLPNVVNGNGNAARFVYYGLPTNTTLNQTVNADFIGTIYAPYAKYTIGGNGTGSQQNIIGASITDSVNFNDLFLFHYDINLSRLGLSRGYLMSSWMEK